MLQWALTHYQVRFIMRASPQTFVNLPALHSTLQSLCNSTSCQHERLYLGSEVMNATIDSEATAWVLHSKQNVQQAQLDASAAAAVAIKHQYFNCTYCAICF